MKKKEPNAMLIRGWFSEKHNPADLGFRKDKGKNSACGIREEENTISEVCRSGSNLRCQSNQLRKDEYIKDEENWSSEVDMGFWGEQDTEEVTPKYADQDGQFRNNRHQTEVFNNKYQNRLIDKENNDRNEGYFDLEKKTLKQSRSQDTLAKKGRHQSLVYENNQITEKNGNNQLIFAETKAKDRGNKENKSNSSKSPVRNYNLTKKMCNSSKSPVRTCSNNTSSKPTIATAMTNQNKRVQQTGQNQRSPLRSLWSSNNNLQFQQENSCEVSNEFRYEKEVEEEYGLEAAHPAEPAILSAQPSIREIELEQIIKKQKEQYHRMLLKFKDQLHQLKKEQKAQQQEKSQEQEAIQQREINLMKKERELQEYQKKLAERQKKQDIKDIELADRQVEIKKAESQIILQQKELEEFMDSLKIKEAKMLALERNQGNNLEGLLGSSSGNDYTTHNGIGYELEEISFCEKNNLAGVVDSQNSEQPQKQSNQQLLQQLSFPLLQGHNQRQCDDGQRDNLKNPFETAKEIKMLNNHNNIITESVDLQQEYNQEGQLEQKRVKRQLFFDSLQTSEQQDIIKESDINEEQRYGQQLQECQLSQLIQQGGQNHSKCEFVVATFDFEAQQVGDMSIHCGDRIQVLRKNKNGWWMGALNGKTGYFPSNFVQPSC